MKNVKRYVADTMVEAMERVRADLGEDAVIVRSSVIKPKGLLKFFKKSKVEVVAGVEQPATFSLITDDTAQPVASQREEENEQLVEELESMKDLLLQIQREQNVTHYPLHLETIYHHLLHQEIEEQLATAICNDVFKLMKEKTTIEWTKEEIVHEVKEQFFQRLSQLSYSGMTYKKKYINIVGPTGVGKTTTIAKVAARTLLEKKKKVAFITTDTYRIGAIEQLKTYANLLQSPVHVVYNREDFEEAVQSFQEYEYVFIDTAGRNYKDRQFIEDLKRLIPFDDSMESYLVLSATSKQKDMEAIIQQFHSIPIEQFIFTKVDETETIGPIINIVLKYNIGIAYCTDGQEVPEDILQVTAQTLAETIVKGAFDD